MEDRELVEYFADLARKLAVIDGVEQTMAVIVNAAVELVGCDHASLSHMRNKQLLSASSNDEMAPLLDRIQTEEQEGPCLDAIREGGVQVCDDLRVDSRWSRFGPRAHDATGVVSCMATQLHAGQLTIGALNLFSNSPGTFAEPHHQGGLVAVLAAHATPALATALRHESAAAALSSRDLIGQAKGILMAHSKVDADEAFRLLVRASQRTNEKVIDVARQLVDRTIGMSEA